MSEIIQVQWCSLCNERPAEGTLVIENPDGEGLPVDLPACKACALTLDWSGVDEDLRPMEARP